LERHPRFHLHFVPTSSSWLNLVERFLAEITQDVVRESSFSSVRQLVRDIQAYLAIRNLEPKPYRWRARGEDLLRKVQRARAALANAKTGVT
jgi:transposase